MPSHRKLDTIVARQQQYGPRAISHTRQPAVPLPLPHISTAHWTKSGWRGWCYGWKLHLVATVVAIWIPLAAHLTPANAADNEIAPALLQELPAEARSVLGDLHYHAPNVQEACDQSGRILATTQYGPYPHSGDGVEVRYLFHQLRSLAIESFNEQFKGIFDGHGQAPTKGLRNTRRFALGAILLHQLAPLYRFQHDQPLRIGFKAFLKAT